MKKDKEKLQKVYFNVEVKVPFYSTEKEKKDVINQIRNNIKNICEDELSFISFLVNDEWGPSDSSTENTKIKITIKNNN